jgi:NtrC-family two-component system sensor histidine kinase KinB
MKITLRHRIILTLVPLFVLLTVLGGAGVVLLYQLGGRIDEILRENYDSVIYMKDLNEAVERIDSSFTFTLAGQKKKGSQQYKKYWRVYLKNLHKEQNNITLPGEGGMVKRLEDLTDKYQKLGNTFYTLKDDKAQRGAYFRTDGLLDTFQRIKKVSEEIRQLNEDNMKEANEEARATAHSSLIWFAGGLVVSGILAVFLAMKTIRAILQPIQAVTESALAIGGGNLDQVVPVVFGDELGQLANAFNTMARQLRDYRQTHQAQLLRAQQTSQATIDSFPDPVLVVDSEGRVELANPAARQLLGVIPESPWKRRALPWHPPDALRQPLAEALHSQQAYLPEGFDQSVVLREAGRERFFLPRLFPIRDPYGGTLGAAVLLRDVTRFRLLDEVKSNLVATVSHELKTPLTGIRLVLHLLLEEATGPVNPKQLELLLDARDNAERLLAMINNLLDLARMEEGQRQLDLHPEPPDALLQAAVEMIRTQAEDQGVDVEVSVPPDLPLVAVDRRQLGHALHNLLNNSLTYTHKGGRITLSAEATDGTVTLSVADTGAGIPAEFLPHVFERFFRVPGKSQHGGTGLGLAIVREIVTAHGGTVSCESQPGEGTTIRLRLPVWTEDRGQGSGVRGQEAGVRGQG